MGSVRQGRSMFPGAMTNPPLKRVSLNGSPMLEKDLVSLKISRQYYCNRTTALGGGDSDLDHVNLDLMFPTAQLSVALPRPFPHDPASVT